MGMTVSRAVGVRIIPIIPGVDAFARALTGASDARVGRARARSRGLHGVWVTRMGAVEFYARARAGSRCGMGQVRGGCVECGMIGCDSHSERAPFA